jgi:uncharacterized protein YabN with tetrapyrrole methylase and pyrophosphatase domain
VSGIVVAGLGPGPADLVPAPARAAVHTAGVVYSAAPDHPVMAAVGWPQPVPVPAPADTGPTVAHLVDAARWRAEPVVLVVPGSPFVLEPVAAGLLAQREVPVRALAATSAVDLLWLRLGIDPFAAGVRLVSAGRLAEEGVRPGSFAVVGRVSPSVRQSLSALPPATLVTVASALGLPGESVRTVPLSDLDTVGVDPELTALHVGNAPATGSALTEALLAQRRGARLGIGLPSLAAAFADVEAEVAEARLDPGASEAGDIIFAAVQISRMLDVDPDGALRAAVRRFTRRLDHVERHADDPGALDPVSLRALWRRAKNETG